MLPNDGASLPPNSPNSRNTLPTRSPQSANTSRSLRISSTSFESSSTPRRSRILLLKSPVKNNSTAPRIFSTASRADRIRSTTAESLPTPSFSPMSSLNSPVENNSIAPPTLSFSASIPSVTLPITSGALLKAPFRSVSPKRPIAAPMLSMEPLNVLPASRAAPPMPFFMAFSNVAKSISPFETISETSSEVLPNSSPRS